MPCFFWLWRYWKLNLGTHSCWGNPVPLMNSCSFSKFLRQGLAEFLRLTLQSESTASASQIARFMWGDCGQRSIWSGCRKGSLWTEIQDFWITWSECRAQLAGQHSAELKAVCSQRCLLWSSCPICPIILLKLAWYISCKKPIPFRPCPLTKAPAQCDVNAFLLHLCVHVTEFQMNDCRSLSSLLLSWDFEFSLSGSS